MATAKASSCDADTVTGTSGCSIALVPDDSGELSSMHAALYPGLFTIKVDGDVSRVGHTYQDVVERRQGLRRVMAAGIHPIVDAMFIAVLDLNNHGQSSHV